MDRRFRAAEAPGVSGINPGHVNSAARNRAALPCEKMALLTVLRRGPIRAGEPAETREVSAVVKERQKKR